MCKGSKRSILSFKPEVYEKIKSGKKKFEHRRNFPDEFNVVFHMDMYKYIISDELGDAEEKKQSLNLHYVGITRAIDVCYIMNGTRRYRAKYGDFYDAKPSSFLFMPGLSERRNDVRWD